jgi:hypothetical protein
MRITSSVTSISWIPSEAITGALKLPFTFGVALWDPPLPDVVNDLQALHDAHRFRFANDLRAWVEVDDDGRISDAGYAGGSYVGATTVRVAGVQRSVPGVGFPELRRDPEYGDGWVRFVQTAGGTTGFPLPRQVTRPPYVQVAAPPAWTTLDLTLHADGTVEREVVGASSFPRHWIYDDEGRLVQKSGLTDWKTWTGDMFGRHTPWGERDYEAVVSDVETALERQLSTVIMRGGAKPKLRKLKEGHLLTEQGQPGDELYLVLDGMLTVEVDGEPVAEVGPGAILGERAVLEGGQRTSTVRAKTRCRVAVASADQIDRDALVELAEGHRREEAAADTGAG